MDMPVERVRSAFHHVLMRACTMPYVTYDIFHGSVLFPVIIERKPWQQRMVDFIRIMCLCASIAVRCACACG